jgi:neutral ceramidase
VLVTATHTHSGPVLLDEYPNGPPAWEAAAIEKIVQAIGQACGRLAEARVGTGKGIAYIGHNRLRQNPDGTVTWFNRNTTMVPTSPLDPTVAVLRVDAADGRPLAILVNYACHPVVFGPDNVRYSADFPGVMANFVEREFGGVPLCMFLQGAPGDINPLHAVTPLQEDAIGANERTGRRLGEETVRVAKAITADTVGDQTIEFSEDSLNFRLRWDPGKFRAAMLGVFGPRAFEEYAAPIKQEMQLPVGTVLINKRIAIMWVPGEAFVDFQINWRARCPVPEAFFVGYANGYYGYFPTIRAASAGGYGGAGATTWVEPSAGERMVDHALVKIYQMLGRLTDTPQNPEF